MTPEVLEQRGIIRDARNMTGSQQAALSLVGGMSAGIFSTFGNNRAWAFAVNPPTLRFMSSNNALPRSL